MKNLMLVVLILATFIGCSSATEKKESSQGIEKASLSEKPDQSGLIVKEGLMPNGKNGNRGPKNADTSWINKKFIDVAYSSKSPTQKLDIYFPNEGKGPFPIIIEFHPGGFIMGSKSGDISPMLEGLKRGYAVASVNYRLSSEAVFPAAVNDVKAAIKFLRANAKTYNLDSNKFVSWGGSAGGNLSAMVAVSSGVKELQDSSLGNVNISDNVQAAVDWFGPIYFSTMDSEFIALGTTGQMGLTNSANSAETKYLGKVIGSAESQSLVEAASPMTYIDKDDPPMYIQHGTADRNIPITQSENFAKKLGESIGKDKVIFEKIEGAGHGGNQFNDTKNVEKIFEFLDNILKPDQVSD